MNFKATLTPEELETVLTPHLRLFMSVDVVGSTAFKHRKTTDGEGKPWLRFIHGFYTGFPGMFAEILEKTISSNGLAVDVARPYLWKALGDELIFCVLLRSPKHARLHLKAFRLALIQAYSKWVAERPHFPINFKGTAWIAGFPIHNTAVPLDAGTPLSLDSEHFDFVGPLLDIGFRLSKHATPRQLVISVDTAWLLMADDDAAGGLDLFYEGRYPLKGVLNDRPYPIFWIDCLDSTDPRNELSQVEDTLLKREAAKPNQVQKLSRAFIKEVQPAIPFPFFHNTPGIPDWFQPAEDLTKNLDAARANIRQIYPVQSERPHDDEVSPEEARKQASEFLNTMDASS